MNNRSNNLVPSGSVPVRSGTAPALTKSFLPEVPLTTSMNSMV